MRAQKVLVHHDCRRTRAELLMAVREARASFRAIRPKDDESLLRTLERTTPRLLLLGVPFRNGEPLDETILAVRHAFPRGALSIVVIADGLAAGEEFLASALGADACVRREGLDPVGLVEAMARLAAYMFKTSEQRLSRCGVMLVREGRRAHIGEDVVDLTDSTFQLFWRLVDQAHRAVPLDELLPASRACSDLEVRRIVQLNVHRLRRRLGRHRRLIETVTGFGYRFNVHWQGG